MGRRTIANGVEFKVRVAAAAILAALLASPGTAQPVLEVQDLRPLSAGNVGRTFLGEVDGRTWFFKADGAIQDIQRYGNFEAEVLVPRVLARFGFLAPRSRVVRIRGQEPAFLQTELVDESFTGGTGPEEPLSLGKAGPDRPLAEQLRLLQLVDTVLGNGDRHLGNYFLARDDQGEKRVVPIDHNLALTTPRVVLGYFNWHLTRGFDGVVAGETPGDPGGLLYPRHAVRSGTPGYIMGRNAYYSDLRDRLRHDPAWRDAALGEARRIREQLSDAVLAKLVGDLADRDFTVGDAAARREEILELVRHRRDALPGYLEGIRPPPPRRGGFLGGLLPGAPRASVMAADPGDPGDAAALDAAIRKAAMGPALLARARPRGPSAPRASGERRARPVRFLELQAFRAEDGRPRLRIKDGTAGRVDERRIEALKPLLRRAIRAARLSPGELMQVEYDPFGDGPGDTYQVAVLSARGEWRHDARLSTEPAQP